MLFGFRISALYTGYFRLAELFQIPYTLTKVKGQDWLGVCCRSFGRICDETADVADLTVVKSSLSLGEKNYDNPKVPPNIIMIFAINSIQYYL